MRRVPIRDSRCSKKTKTRVMDFIENDDGSYELEVKDGSVTKSILLEDFKKQCQAAMRKKE